MRKRSRGRTRLRDRQLGHKLAREIGARVVRSVVLDPPARLKPKLLRCNRI